jgi:microcystin-dependent protein
MAYQIQFTDYTNKGSIIVEDREINSTDTSLQLPGRNSTAYGEAIAGNFLHLLENFANNNAPANPVEGQTWYDTTVGVDALKVYDGTNWVESGGIKKGAAQPEVGNSVIGDLWVDTSNQQLYLNNGSSWILVGPEFSEGLSSGTKAEQIQGTDDLTYTVLKVEVGAQPVAIITNAQFIPKVNIRGFSELKPGFNLTSLTLSNTIARYNGTAESADSLRIQNVAIPAANFLRADVNTTSSGIIYVKNNQGVQVGANSQLALEASGESGVVKSNFNGASLDFKVKNDQGEQTAIRIKSDTNVGINNENPQVPLDVTGSGRFTGNLDVNGIEDADDSFNDTLTEGTIVTSGGLSVAKNVKIGNKLTVKGQTNIGGDIVADPDALTKPNMEGFGTVKADTFEGFFNGSMSGTINGTASSAAKLNNKTVFQMSGDVSSDAIVFDGAGDLTKTFTTVLSDRFITDKSVVVTPQTGDELLINRTQGDGGLFRITQSNLLKGVPRNPVGMIVPFAGEVAPPGWYLCDGTEIRQTEATDLFNIIGFKFKDPQSASFQNPSSTFFALPDFRGRFLLGADNMGGLPANTVTNTNADNIGGSSGSEFKDIKVKNLPEHEHDLKSPGGTQHYAIIDDTVPAAEDGSINQPLNIAQGSQTTSGIPSSGGIKEGGTDGQGTFRGAENLGEALDALPPFVTVNYIIFADNV